MISFNLFFEITKPSFSSLVYNYMGLHKLEEYWMKKIFLTLITLMVFIVLVACAEKEVSKEKNDTEQATENNENEKVKDKEKAIEVDKNLLSVEVTLPSSMFENQNIEDVISEAKADGVKEIIKNDDGSLTYKMSKAKHAEMMKDMEVQINSTLEDLKNNKDFASIKDVVSNKTFSEFTVSVDKESYENSFDGFATLTLAISGMYYQLFNGVSPDKYKVIINLKDEATGELFNSITYPDDLE